MSELSIDLVARDRKVWSGSARMISAPSTDGQVGIMAGHTPMLAVLRPGGLVRITTSAGPDVEVRVSGGFMSVDDNLVTVVADSMSPVEGSN